MLKYNNNSNFGTVSKKKINTRKETNYKIAEALTKFKRKKNQMTSERSKYAYH